MVRITRITMDYVTQPLGLMKLPQFGWVITGDGRNEKQRGYRLQIARDEDFGVLFYDSQRVEDGDSAHITVPERPLVPLCKYFVRVKVFMADGQVSEWSAPAYFVTGIGADEWKAGFVTVDREEDARNSKTSYLRKEFTVGGEIREAWLVCTALGLYIPYLNGKRVGRDELLPGFTSYHKHLLYQTYEVTELVGKGENVIGAIVGAGWYKGRMGVMGNYNNYGTQSGFLAQLYLKYADGQEEWVVTDGSWKGHDAPVVFAEIYDGETYDARKEIKGWALPGAETGSWKAANMLPYGLAALSAQVSSQVKVHEEIPVKCLFKTPKGETVLDFGQNLTGWIKIKGAGEIGEEIVLKCFEVLDRDGNVYLDNLRKAKQQIRYIFGEAGRVKYHPSFTFMGFRYAAVTAYPGEPAPEDFTACVVHSEMGDTGFFECSHPLLNQLQSNIRWGMKGNFVDIPTDCPQRNERLGWTGDAQIFCRTASYLMNTYQFYKKWLKDLAADQTPEGGVPHVVPDLLTGKPGIEKDALLSAGTHSAAAWGDAAVIIPWVLYLTYGDKEILRLQYESMKAWIDFMRTHAEDYIWNYQLQFGDWVALDAAEGSYFGATPNNLTCTAYFAYSTGLFVKICQVLGCKTEAAFYGKLYDNILTKYQKTFFQADGRMTVATQTAHIVSLFFDLTPEKYKETVVAELKQLLEKEGGHLVTGFVGTPYFCHALSENGCVQEAYELLLKEDYPSWLFQIKMGATTIWEHWDGIRPDGTMWSPDMNSFNHYAYGAVGEWLYRVCAGIEIDAGQPGYRHIIFRPRMGGGLDFARGQYESAYGTVRSGWAIENGVATMEFSVPVNATATVYLTQCRELLETDGVAFQRTEDSREKEGYVGKIGSGHYRIRFRPVGDFR